MISVRKEQINASQRLSSGYRINSASDDAAGLAITEKMRAQIRGLDQAARNAQDAISLIQVAEGATSTIGELLIRARELVVQAANDTYLYDPSNLSRSDRTKIQFEINQIMEEINSIAERTQFNTMPLLDGRFAGVDGVVQLPFLPGLHTITTGPHDFFTTDPGGMVLSSTAGYCCSALCERLVESLFVWGSQMSLTGSGRITFGTFDAVAGNVFAFSHGFPQATNASIVVIDPNGVEHQVGEGEYFLVRTASEGWTIAIDFSGEPPGAFVMASLNIIRMTEVIHLARDLHFQIGANSGQGMLVNIFGMDTTALGGTYGDLRNISVENTSGEAIARQLSHIDYALARVNRNRVNLGAAQNRLEFTIENLNLSSENLLAAKSRIKDADMAQEMMNLISKNTLQQASISMLAQANQSKDILLRLIGN